MKKGFTLSELLLSLTIVGVIATLTVPVLMSNVQNKMFANQVKNMSATIEQLAQDELIAKRTRDLSDTDFGDPTKLLTEDHFSIAKTCTTGDASNKCWKTSLSGKEKVTYKLLNRSNLASMASISYNTVILKNGVIIATKPVSDIDGNTVFDFLIDVNGNDKPNIAGRDLFEFYVSRKGHVIDYAVIRNEEKTLEQKMTGCKTALVWCYGALSDNGWKMDY